MSKITLAPLANLQQQTTAVSVINSNFQTISTAIDNTLSRDGTSPNAMGSNLDMNNLQILNLPAPATINSPVRLVDVPSGTGVSIASVPPVGTSGATVPLLNGNNTWSGTNTYTLPLFFSVVPNYNLGSGTLAVNELFSTTAVSVPLNSNWNHIRLSQSSGANNTATVGANSLYVGLYSSIESLSGSDSTSNTYGLVGHATNDGPGNVRGAHLGGFGGVGCTGFTSAAALQIQPVATQAGAWGAFASLTSSDVNGLAVGYEIFTTGDTFQIGFGSSVASVGYALACYRAWMATASAAGARAFQTLQNDGTEIQYIKKTGEVVSSTGLIAGTESNGINITSFAITRNTAAGALTINPGASSLLVLANQGTGVQFGNAASFSAPASVATALGSIGPVGSHTTVQTWLTVLDSAGVTRYIPCF